MSFYNASNFIVNGSTFVYNSIRNGRDALHLLSHYVAQGATHDSYVQEDAPKCHPDTREQLLSDIKQWMLEPDKETGILYLHGPAGAGKSCIARSSCAHACPPGFLLASFFFWRGSEERNNITKLFTTIAYQLAMMNDDLAGFISDAIQRNPRIVSDASVMRQFEKLILEPCRSLADMTGEQLYGAIIIDGLDECVDKDAQISVVELLAMMVNKEGFSLGFFVTSRPELHLSEIWGTEDIAPVAQFISLANIRNTSKDIQTVLESGFSRILNDRRFQLAPWCVSRPWPSRDAIETLVERSSEQFIYAATVLKFVSSRSHNPDARLQIILAFPGCGSDTSPLAELDSLYHGILSRADDPARTITILSYLLAILDIQPSRYFYYDTDITKNLIEAINNDMNKQLLVVEQLLSLPRGEAFLAFNELHALINFDDPTGKVSFYHKSFRDFLLTSGRSKEFHIDIQATHAMIVKSCAKFLCLPQYATVEQHVGWLYSFFMWPFHIKRSGKTEEISNCEPAQRFIGTQVHFNYVHLRDAFILLQLDSENKFIQIVEVLTGFRRLSAFTFNAIKQELWNSHNDDLLEEFIRNPLLVAHLKSYKMDVLTVKQSLAIHAIVSFRVLYKSGLYSTGIIHDLASLPEIQEDMIIDWVKNSYNAIRFWDFLCNPRLSGIFSCTPEDFADAYCDIIKITAPVSSAIENDEYSKLMQEWTWSLKAINPAATPALLAALESAARDAHDQPGLNMSLTGQAELHLLEWLENLPSPPQYIIYAWRKAFDKARQATVNHGRDDYRRIQT